MRGGGGGGEGAAVVSWCMRAVAADGLEDKTKVAAGERTARIGSWTGRLGGGQQGPGEGRRTS
jgi:hypothetical protein